MSQRCHVCDGEIPDEEGPSLPCAAGGHPFHLRTRTDSPGQDCGVLTPNLTATGCCGLLYLCAECAALAFPEGGAAAAWPSRR